MRDKGKGNPELGTSKGQEVGLGFHGFINDVGTGQTQTLWGQELAS